MTHAISELAKEFETKPGVLYGVLSDLGIDHDGIQFEAEDEVVELVKESLLEHVGSREIVLKKGAVTPRTVVMALELPQAEIQKTLMFKLKTPAQLTTVLKDEIVEKLVAEFDYTVRWADSAPKPKPVAKANAKATGAQPRPPVVTIMGHGDQGEPTRLT